MMRLHSLTADRFKCPVLKGAVHEMKRPTPEKRDFDRIFVFWAGLLRRLRTQGRQKSGKSCRWGEGWVFTTCLPPTRDALTVTWSVP